MEKKITKKCDVFKIVSLCCSLLDIAAVKFCSDSLLLLSGYGAYLKKRNKTTTQQQQFENPLFSLPIDTMWVQIATDICACLFKQ